MWYHIYANRFRVLQIFNKSGDKMIRKIEKVAKEVEKHLDSGTVNDWIEWQHPANGRGNWRLI